MNMTGLEIVRACWGYRVASIEGTFLGQVQVRVAFDNGFEASVVGGEPRSEMRARFGIQEVGIFGPDGEMVSGSPVAPHDAVIRFSTAAEIREILDGIAALSPDIPYTANFYAAQRALWDDES